MDSVLRVLHFADIINRYDFIDNVIRYCDRERFRLCACTFTNRTNIQPPGYTDIPHYVLGATSRRSYPRALARLVSILRTQRIDIVHTHHFDPTVIGVAAARLTGCTAIIGRHYSDSVHRLASSWKRHLYLGAEAVCYRLAARTIVPSTYVYDLLTRVQAVEKRKVAHIPYGFDLEKYTPTRDGPSRIRQRFAPGGETLIGCFGRLHREKGQIHLLRAVRSLLPAYPRLRVVFVGEGADRSMLENTIREMGLADSAVLAGWRTDVVDFLSAVDVVVQPSISGEGFSQAMVEALAVARPLIVTDVSGARDIVNHGETGLIVSPEDPGAIADSLRMLLTATQFARQLGEAGREYVRQQLDIRRIVRRYEECYLAAYAESIAA